MDSAAGLASRLLLQVREDVHARGVPPEEERLVRLLGALNEVERLSRDFSVHRLPALLRQRAGVDDLAASEAVNHAARTKLLLELGVLRIVGMLRLFLRVQVVE